MLLICLPLLCQGSELLNGNSIRLVFRSSWAQIHERLLSSPVNNIKPLNAHMCLFSFHSIAMDCGTLNATTNGQVKHTAGTTFGQTATYSCDTGYNLVGDGTRTCQADGMWSGNEPTCQGV